MKTPPPITNEAEAGGREAAEQCVRGHGKCFESMHLVQTEFIVQRRVHNQCDKPPLRKTYG